jgi:F-type H+-transporting ATPase subunit alpha
LRLDLASYRELEAFTQFGSDLDDATKSKLERGKRTVEIMKQELHKTLPFELQAMSIFALTKGHLDSISLEDIKRFESDMHRFFEPTIRWTNNFKSYRVSKTLPDFSKSVRFSIV